MNIWNGIKSKWGEFIAWWAKQIQKIRDYLPFSPAKTGPLRDIHRIRLMETIAMSIKPAPLLNAMDSSLNTVASMRPCSTAGGGYGGGHSFSINISLTGGATKADGDMVGAALEQAIMRTVRKMDENKKRVSY